MDIVNNIFNWVLSASNEWLAVLAAWAIGYVMRFIPQFPNRFIPILVILGTALFYALLPQPVHWDLRRALIGLVLGMIGWVLHKFILKRLEEKLPGPLKEALDSADKEVEIPPANATDVAEVKANETPAVPKQGEVNEK